MDERLENLEERLERLTSIFERLKSQGVVHTQKDFADSIGVSKGQMSKALAGQPKDLTAPLLRKAEQFCEEMCPVEPETISPQSVCVIPTCARGGTLGDFSESVTEYQCERIISPVHGADYAIQVTGDSMAPEYPNGCHILIKKIDEKQFIEWGRVFVLDTDNGAVIKQVYPTADKDLVECRSLNSNYPPFRVHFEDIHGWYRVLMALSIK